MSSQSSPSASQSPSKAFASACAFVVDRLEGGAQPVTDSGGLTRWGISQRAYPGEDIAALTRPRAFALYHRDYWRPLRADELPRGLDLLVFDAAVNQGVAQAVKLLQRVLRVSDDGVLGPDTLGAASRWIPASELRAQYTGIRLRWYQELVALKPVHTPSLHGWRLRCCRVADEAGARAAR